MNAEIITGSGVMEANLEVARAQGRISEGEKPRWRSHYEKVGYEAATQDLLSRKAARNVAPARSYSEAQWDAYARATFVTRPPIGTFRSV
ncbi:MAG TPA: hypothetical protein VIM33_05465 [Gaiellaceae bacterium]|jgi:hypothetical protein